MSWIIPDAEGNPYPKLSRWFEADTFILGRAAGGRNGVVSGLGVHELDTPGMGVEMESGRFVYDGVPFDNDGGVVALADAHPTLDRLDLIVAGVEQDTVAIQGEAATSPVMPYPIAGSIAVGLVIVPALDNAVTNDQIRDLRIPVGEPLGATQWNTLSAAGGFSRSNTTALAADPILAFEMSPNTRYRVRAVFTMALFSASGGKWGIFLPGTPTSMRIDSEQRVITPTLFNSNLSSQPIYRMLTQAEVSGFPLGMSGAGEGVAKIKLEGWIHNGASGGDFAIATAQQTAVANGTERQAGSVLEYEVA